MSDTHRVAERVADIRRRIDTSAARAGRRSADITLVAACKRQSLDRIRAAHDAGVEDFGENLAQGLRATAEAFDAEGRTARWHFIGPLQRNKVNTVLRHASVIHSVDRIELAEAISRRVEPGRTVDVLVEVNIGREPTKAGADPDQAIELCRAVARLPNLRLRGLMAIPPAEADPRPFYARMQALSEQLQGTEEGRGAAELSIGMSDDFEIAIAHGATMVRVGTALFGPRENNSGA